MRWIWILPLLASCDDHLFRAEGSRASCDREPALTYENFGAGFLAKYCTGCHGSLQKQSQRANAPPGVDFDTWQGTLDWADRIWVRAVEEGNMPPAGQPGADELARFAEWMECEVMPAAGVQP